METVPIAINRLTGLPFGVDPEQPTGALDQEEDAAQRRREEIAALGYPLTQLGERVFRWTGERLRD